jgi:predicted short-subunit dehydrogenase-like oxidoreductase (DUF2520 family)
MKIQTQKIGIIGAGQVGSLLAKFSYLNNRLLWILARNEKRIKNLLELSIPEQFVINSIDQIIELPEIIIICVNDNEIQNVVNNLCDIFGNKLKSKIIFHTSGFLNKDILVECQKFGANTGACHPYQTFYDNKIEILQGIGWGIDCYSETYNQFSEIIKFLRGKPIYLDNCTPENKALYHLSAVAASNFLSSVIQLSKHIAAEAGINADDFIPQIATQTLNNSINCLNKKDFPLTGPYARGDHKAIEKHIQSLGDNQSLIDIYCYSAIATLELSFINKLVDNENYEKIKIILKKHINLQ